MHWREVRTGFKAPDKYIQEQHNKKKTRATTWRDVLQTEGGFKKSFKECKYAVNIIDDKEFYQARKWLEAERKCLKGQMGQNVGICLLSRK